ncbi:MAG: tRNA guanosine(34) transglycosylase Tgt, partial [Phycisphaerae bacterium]
MDNFQILYQDSNTKARRGLLITKHGKVETPAFLPVGTAGAVKGITPQQLQEIGTDIILANTYHLMLRPGVDVIEKLGGLHKFMAWNRPILTDSGGYQIFSLSFSHKDTKSRRNLKGKKNKYNEPSCLGALVARIDDDGVEFASHVDGAKIYLDAETAIKIQNRLDADIIMCLDQCTPFPADQQQLEKAVERTIRWAKRAKQAHANSDQLLFAVVQGGINLQLRTHCSSELVKLDFDGYAIGGLSVGEGHDNMVKTVNHTTQLLPENLPRYLMGVGTPADIIAAVRAGVDM